MAGVDNNLQAMLKLASEKPEYRALVEYLIYRRALPSFESKYLGDSTLGQFVTNTAWGKELPNTGVVQMNRKQAGPETTDTMTHELTHAAQRQMTSQYLEIMRKPQYDRTPQEQQFFDNYYKAYGYNSNDKNIGMRGLLSSLTNPQWLNKNKEYRSNETEAPAWAMGSVVNPPTSSNPDPYETPAHLNPTLASGFQVLLDQAQRLQSNTYNRSQGR